MSVVDNERIKQLSKKWKKCTEVRKYECLFTR